MSSGPFTILVVCTGNICRSPQGERLFQAGFTRAGLARDVAVSSAGTAALVGRPMEPQAAALTAAYGGDPDAHVARRLEEWMVGSADLVLTMERAHRADVVRMLPRSSRNTFTLREFARLVVDLREAGEFVAPPSSTAPADRLRWLVPQVAARRGMALPAPADDDDVVDPYRRSAATYETSAKQTAVAVSTSVSTLAMLANESRPDGYGS